MQGVGIIKILVIDYRALVCNGVSAILDLYPDFQVVGRARSKEESLRLLKECNPDVVTVDVELPGQAGGLELIRQMRHQAPHVQILVLTNLLDEIAVQHSLQLGVTGYLLKNTTANKLAEAVRAAFDGVPTLSPEVTRLVIRELAAPSHPAQELTSRERQVLKSMAHGLNNHEIADELSVSLSTVQFHVSNILHKLGVHNRIEAATFAIRHQLVD